MLPVWNSANRSAGSTNAVRQDGGVIELEAARQDEADVSLGHWRNRWQVPERHSHLAREQGALPLGDGTWLGYKKFATEAEAEGHARKYIAYNMLHFEIRYMGPEFFPEY